jgi:hypothetical protein
MVQEVIPVMIRCVSVNSFAVAKVQIAVLQFMQMLFENLPVDDELANSVFDLSCRLAHTRNAILVQFVYRLAGTSLSRMTKVHKENIRRIFELIEICKCNRGKNKQVICTAVLSLMQILSDNQRIFWQLGGSDLHYINSFITSCTKLAIGNEKLVLRAEETLASFRRACPLWGISHA